MITSWLALLPLAAPYLDGPDYAAHAGLALDPALLFGVGFGHAVELGRGENARRLALGYDVATVPSFSTWDVRASGGMRVFQHSGLDALVGTELELKILNNPVHAGVSLNPRFSGLGGYFGDAWFVAGELSSQFSVTSSLWHTDEYQRLFPDVHDGFIGPGALYWYTGAVVGVRFWRAMADLRFAWRWSADFGDKGPYLQPYTLHLRVGVPF